jgi:hypothetical protein
VDLLLEVVAQREVEKRPASGGKSMVVVGGPGHHHRAQSGDGAGRDAVHLDESP